MEKRRYHLLAIEDNPADVGLMRAALKPAGLDDMVELRCAYDGESGLRLLESSQREGLNFDMILLDLNMPKMSGKALLGELKRGVMFAHIPVFIMSNSDEKSDIEECHALGADAFFQKPYDFSRLVDFFIAVRQSLELKECVSAPQVKSQYKALRSRH